MSVRKVPVTLAQLDPVVDHPKAMRLGGQALRALGARRQQEGNLGGSAECYERASQVDAAAQLLEAGR